MIWCSSNCNISKRQNAAERECQFTLTVKSPGHWRQHWRLVSRSSHSQDDWRSRQPKHESGFQDWTATHRDTSEGSNFPESESCVALVTDSSAKSLFPGFQPIQFSTHFIGCDSVALCSENILLSDWRKMSGERPFSTSQEIQIKEA